MNKPNLRYICILTIFFLFTYFIGTIIPGQVLAPVASAATLQKDDLYRGLGIALLLIILAKIGKNYEEPEDFSGISNEDLELLARVIHAEARGEPFEGQVAVGAVVLNRVKSPDFPNTIKEVIYQPRQFSSVSDGQINLKPNQSSYQAAREALSGRDPSLGALYFYNPDLAETLWWLSTRKTTIKIGNHVFAK